MTAPIDKWSFKEVKGQRLIFIFNSLYRLDFFDKCLWPSPPAPSLPSTCCLPSQPGRPEELRHNFFLIALLLFLIVCLPRLFSSRSDVRIYKICQFLTFSEPHGRGKGSKVQWRRGQHRRRETFLAFQMCCRAPLIAWNQPGQVQKSVIVIFINFSGDVVFCHSLLCRGPRWWWPWWRWQWQWGQGGPCWSYIAWWTPEFRRLIYIYPPSFQPLPLSGLFS